MEDKKGLVQQEIQFRQQQKRGNNKAQALVKQRQKRKLEIQMQRIKSAKYNSSQKQSRQQKRIWVRGKYDLYKKYPLSMELPRMRPHAVADTKK